MNIFFTTGMFRSGTTLIARMLQAHPEIACASDPFAPIFKAFRNEFSIKSNYKIDLSSPHDDYYFSSGASFLHDLQRTSLNICCDSIVWEEFIYLISKSLEAYSPLLIPHLSKLEGSNYKQILSNGLDIIHHTYGNNKTKLVGFKEVWTNEFGTHLLSDFPHSKVLHIIRDPRSVCSSNYASNAPYPLIFLARQWRKACAAAIYQKKFSKFKDRVFILRYEDLISSPDLYIPKICRFLKIKVHENMYNPEKFLDGNNKPWIQNSSYEKPISGFNPKSLNRWKNNLTDQQVTMIEFLCSAEMKLFKYKEFNTSSSIIDVISTPPEISQTSVAEWLKPYVDQSRKSLTKELSKEFFRYNALRSPKRLNNNLSLKLGLWSEVFNLLQNNNTNERKINF